jgi:hypothetical protein
MKMPLRCRQLPRLFERNPEIRGERERERENRRVATDESFPARDFLAFKGGVK